MTKMGPVSHWVADGMDMEHRTVGTLVRPSSGVGSNLPPTVRPRREVSDGDNHANMIKAQDRAVQS